MPLDPVDALLDRLTKGGQWPPQSEAATWRAVRTWRAFAESDRAALRTVAGWNPEREYRVDPLAGRIVEAWADHLMGEDVEVTPANDRDEALLTAIVEGNDFTEETRHAIRDYITAEGETWWRVYVDRELADVPLIEWHSRETVAPLYIGRRLLAVALITVLEGPGYGKAGANAVYRHLEIHVDGAVEHVVFRGTKDRIGGTVPLAAHPETEELAAVLGEDVNGRAVWNHGLPRLMGRIVNRRGRDRRVGVSEFAGIRDYLLDLNEAVSIAAENARLTAKKRVVVPESSARASTGPELVDRGDGSLVPVQRATFDAGEDVLIADTLNEELGRESTPPFKVLEYSFDATALIAHKRDLVESALTRTGLTPQTVGIRVEGEGFAVSGTSLRFRLIPTDKAAKGKGRELDAELPRILQRAELVDALPEAAGGFGRVYADTETPPTVKRANPLPNDPVEDATVESTLVGSGVRSVETSVRSQHPEWTEELIAAEVARIRDERKATAGGFGAGLA